MARLGAATVMGLGLGALTLGACSSDSLVLPSDREPADVAVLTGGGQVDTVGKVLPDSLVVRVTDRGGRPVMDVSVRFVPPPGPSAPQVVPEVALTNEDGRATARVQLGTVAGPQVVRADVTVAGGVLSTDFRLNALPAAPDTMLILSGDSQSGIVGSQLDLPLVVLATDRFGNASAGVTVGWTTVGGGSVSATTSVTDAAGQASVRRTLGPTPGAQQAVATSPGLHGSPLVFNHTASQGIPTSLIAESGNNQTGQPGKALPLPLVVRLVDELGNGVPGRVVTWPIAAGGGTVLAASQTTDATGRVSATWTLGPGDGTNIVVPTSGSLTALFTATASLSPPTKIQAASSTQLTGTAGAAVSPDPAVLVTDANGKPVAGVMVAFAVTAGGGSVSPASVPTDANGVATVSTWLLGSSVGTNTLAASVNGPTGPLSGSPVTFTAQSHAGPVSRLEIVTQPSSTGVSGVPLDRAPVIRLVDANGNAVLEGGVEISAALSGSPSGATLTPASASTNAEGQATFDGVTLTAPAGTYRLDFATSGPVAGVTSEGIALTAAVGSLAMVVQPSPALANGAILAAQPQVRVLDQFGIPIAGVSVSATVQPNTVTLGGQSQVGTDALGIARYTDLTLTGTVGTYVLTFTAGGHSVLSAAIVLSPGAASASQSTAVVPSHGRVKEQTVIVVQARDQSGNPLTTGGNTVVITVTGKNPVAPFTALDRGDGSYRGSYEPHTKGKDFIAITLDGAPIKGSPFTSDVR